MQISESRYAPAWEKLKAERKVILVAPKGSHNRIVKGIKRRRDKDVLFLFRIRNDGMTHKITVTSEANVLTLVLSLIVTVHGL